MTRRVRILASAVLAGSLALAGTACGTAKADKNAPDPTDRLTIVVPQTLAGLKVSPSKKATETLLAAGKGPNNYQKDAQVFELRLGKELQAVLQITRLTADARTDQPDFRRRIIESNLINASREAVTFAGIDVYKASVNRQTIYVWFQSKFMEVLMVRSDSITLAQQGAINVTALVTAAVQLKPTAA